MSAIYPITLCHLLMNKNKWMDFNRVKFNLHIMTTNYYISTSTTQPLGHMQPDLQVGLPSTTMLFPKQSFNLPCLSLLICQMRITVVPKFSRQTED